MIEHPASAMRGAARIAPDIPRFQLYGEPALRSKPAFLHIEAIATRSREHGWIIQPHRHGDLHQIFLLTKGGGRVTIKDVVQQQRAPALLNIPADVVHGFEWEAGTNGHVLTIGSNVLAAIVARFPEFDAAARELGLARGTEIDALFGQMERSMRALTAEIGWSESAESPVAEAHLLLCLAAAQQILKLETNEPHRGSKRDRELFERFRREVEATYREHPAVPDLARRLGTSGRRLNDACRVVVGMSPLAVVHRRQITEAKRKLLSSLKPVAEIAYELGYDDPAYFTRFFTARVGRSPRAFRQSGPVGSGSRVPS